MSHSFSPLSQNALPCASIWRMPKRVALRPCGALTATVWRFGFSGLHSLKSGTFTVALRSLNATGDALAPSNETSAVSSAGSTPFASSVSSTVPVFQSRVRTTTRSSSTGSCWSFSSTPWKNPPAR